MTIVIAVGSVFLASGLSIYGLVWWMIYSDNKKAREEMKRIERDLPTLLYLRGRKKK